MPSSSDEDGVSPPLIVTRAEWDARKPKLVKKQNRPVADVIYTDTDTRECRNKDECRKLIKEIQNFHMDVKDLPDIQHHFLIGGDGEVYEGRGWDTQGPVYEKNGPTPEKLTGRSLEVAFVGKYTVKPPSDKMMNKAQKLVQYGMKINKVQIRKPEEDDDTDAEGVEEITEEQLNSTENAIELPPGLIDHMQREQIQPISFDTVKL